MQLGDDLLVTLAVVGNVSIGQDDTVISFEHMAVEPRRVLDMGNWTRRYFNVASA